MIKIATPISHLFDNKIRADIIIKNSDCLECRDRSIESKENNQELFHCELQPIHNWSNEEFDYLRKIKEIKKDLKLISFHIASNCDKPIIKNGMFELGGKAYSKNELLNNAKYNFSKIKQIFGQNITIAVENNNYYPTNAYQYITEPDFISKVVYDNGINFLFDIAHAKVTCYNQNINFEKYKQNLPLDKMVQIHICSYDIDYDIDYDKSIAFDAHNYPDSDELVEVKKLILKYKDVKYLTVEYYRDIENLEKSLKEVRKLI
jgi:uncharacterized protein (UPF0276 family)